MHPIGFNFFVDYNGDLRLCYRRKKVILSFYFYNIRDVFQIEGMLNVSNFVGMGAVFETNQRIRHFRNSLDSR